MAKGVLSLYRVTHEQNNVLLSTCVKQFLSFRQGGMKPGDAFRSIQKMGYNHTLRSLWNHVKMFETTGRAIQAPSGKRGMPRKLKPAQEAIVLAEVVACNKENCKTNHRKLIKFVKDTWSIDVSMSTIKRIEKRVKVGKRTLSKRSQHVKFVSDELSDMLYEWIVSQRKSNVFVRPKSEIFSLDVTTTKPPEGEFTLSPQGSGKQRSATKVTVNTDAIVTVICAAGGNPCPCVLFTSNVRLNLDQKNTPRGREIHDYLTEKLDFYEIDPSRVVYEAGKAYTAESPERYIHVIDKYLASAGIPPQALICHDGGNAFKPHGVSIFDDYTLEGVDNVKLDHVVYPSPVHQYLSPNDNKIHGIKSTWYLEYEDLDDVCRSLRLMQLLDKETAKNAKKYFNANIFKVKPSHLPLIIANKDVVSTTASGFERLKKKV